ncbi:MAG: hypothetical protein AAF184_07590 [Pseudomonadota bacterium]
MTIQQHAVRFLVLCMLGASGTLAAATAAEGCAAERGNECSEEAQAAAETSAGSGDAAVPGEADGAAAYSWEDLVELVPELRDYKLSYQGDAGGEGEDNYLVCRKFKVTGTHIPKRRCAPLLQFMAYKLAQRRRAEATRVNILLLPSKPPPVILQ